MTPERWQQIERLFHAARECHREDREAWLSAACGGDDALLQEVTSLLRGDGTLFDHGVEHAAATLLSRPSRDTTKARPLARTCSNVL